MEFVWIALITLMVCVFLAFKIINYLGLRLGLEPLILCALCALSINIALPSVTLYMSNYHFVFFVGLILLSASLITYYNERYPARRPPSRNNTTEPALEYASCMKPTLNGAGAPFLMMPAPEAKPALPAYKRPRFIPAAPESEIVADPQNETTVPQAAPPEKPQACPFPAPLPKPAQRTRPQSYLLPALITPTVRTLAEQAMKKKACKRKLAALLNLKSLDALLDYAYEQKSAADVESALSAFQCALNQYRNDDYAPFITIEIGNIYKNTGLYDEAIVIYNKAFYLRAVMASDDLQKEFKNMIYYLHILKIILRHHHRQAIPLDQIPQPILLETENEFQHWLAQKYAS